MKKPEPLNMKLERVQGDQDPNERIAVAIDAERARKLLAEVPAWECEVKHEAIVRSFEFSYYGEAMAFVKQVADLAFDVDLSPEIHVIESWVRLRLAGGWDRSLSEADFELARKIDLELA